MVREKLKVRKPTNYQKVMNLVTDICRFSCKHYDRGSGEFYEKFIENPILSRTESSKESVRCEDCSISASFMWSCLDCYKNFCGGEAFKPNGHARLHAKATGHNWAVQCDVPLSGWCYRCNSSVQIKVTGINNMEMKSVTDAKNVVSGRGNGYRISVLKNPGITYFNSVLQNVLAVDELREYFTGLEGWFNGLTSALRKLFEETGFVGDPKEEITSDALLQALCSECPMFHSNQHGHDWLTCLLVGLDYELQWSGPVLESNFVYETFSVQFFNTPYYEKCKHAATLCERFLVLPLAVPVKEPADNRDQASSSKKNPLPVEEGDRGCNKDQAEVGPSDSCGNLLNKLPSALGLIVQNDWDDPVTIEDCLNLFVKREPSCCRICSRFLQFKKAENITKGLDNPIEDAVVSQGALNIKNLDSSNPGVNDQDSCPHPQAPRGKKRQSMGKSIQFPECFFRGVFIHLDVLPPAAPHKDEIISELDHNLSSSGGEASSLQENLDKIHDDSPFVHDVKSVVSDGSNFVSGSEQGQTETNLQSTSTMSNDNEVNELEHEDSWILSKTDSEDNKKIEHLETQGRMSCSALSTRAIVDKPPRILAIQLIRPHHGSKLGNSVKFLEYLDLKPFMHNRFGKAENTLYRLIGVVENEANNVTEGHHIAYVHGRMEEDSDLTWFRVSDDDASPVPFTEVLKSEPYNLFYKRVVDKY